MESVCMGCKQIAACKANRGEFEFLHSISLYIKRSLLWINVKFSSKLLEITTMPTWCRQRAIRLPTVLQYSRLHFELQSPYHSWVEGEHDGLRGRYWPFNPQCTVMTFLLRWAAHHLPSNFRHSNYNVTPENVASGIIVISITRICACGFHKNRLLFVKINVALKKILELYTILHRIHHTQQIVIFSFLNVNLPLYRVKSKNTFDDVTFRPFNWLIKFLTFLLSTAAFTVLHFSIGFWEIEPFFGPLFSETPSSPFKMEKLISSLSMSISS